MTILNKGLSQTKNITFKIDLYDKRWPVRHFNIILSLLYNSMPVFVFTQLLAFLDFMIVIYYDFLHVLYSWLLLF